MYINIYIYPGWWLGWTPLKNMTSSIGMIRHSQYEWENAQNGNQTTIQLCIGDSYEWIYI